MWINKQQMNKILRIGSNITNLLEHTHFIIQK